MRAILGTALAWLALAHPASAQAPTIEDFTRDLTFWSARLSPDGRNVAGMVRRGTEDVLLIIDWRAGASRAIQTADAGAGQNLNWVRWKSNDRLIFSAIHEVPLTRRLIGRSAHSDEPDELPIERVYAINRTGENLRQMLESQTQRLWPDRADVSML